MSKPASVAHNGPVPGKLKVYATQPIAKQKMLVAPIARNSQNRHGRIQTVTAHHRKCECQETYLSHLLNPRPHRRREGSAHW